MILSLLLCLVSCWSLLTACRSSNHFRILALMCSCFFVWNFRVPSSVFATTSSFTFSDLFFLSVKIRERSTSISRRMWHVAHPSCLWMLVYPRQVFVELHWSAPSSNFVRGVFTKLFLSEFVLNVRKASVVGSEAQLTCAIWHSIFSLCSLPLPLRTVPPPEPTPRPLPVQFGSCEVR